jgi:hypothetical protein
MANNVDLKKYSPYLYKPGALTSAQVESIESAVLQSSSQVANVLTNVSSGGFSSYAAGSSGSATSNSTVSRIAKDLLQLTGKRSLTNVSTTAAASSSTATTLEASAFSQIEAAILSANRPIDISENEVITVNGQTGLWSNKSEVVNWRGAIPITDYVINEDQNPEVVRKRTDQVLQYEHEIAVRYLRPPTPPPPGEIHINLEKNIPTAPAPPLVIRQQPPRPETPTPLVIREAPPKPPSQIGQKMITISGKRIPPPPRKVVIERLAPLPSKPQAVIIERWLPYKDQKRRVIFTKPSEPDPIVPKPRNVVIQWEQPQVNIKKEFRDLGVIRANPVEYVTRYGTELKEHVSLPNFVTEIRPPSGVILAAEHQSPKVVELFGDLDALKLIDLEREGLSEYRYLLQQSASYSASSQQQSSFAAVSSSSASALSSRANVDALIAEIFARVDVNSTGRITLAEAEKILLILNSELGRSYGENEAKEFFEILDTNRDGSIDFDEFKSALYDLIQ